MVDDGKRLVLLDLKYETLQNVGQGAFGSVILLKDRTTEVEYIAKVVNTTDLTEKQRELALNEANVLAELEHPHIIKYEECYSDSFEFYIVMEYAKHGDLWKVIQNQKALHAGRPFPEEQVMRWFVQISSALYYLHSCDVLHRDLKSRNILLAEEMDNLKIADFGMAKIFDPDCRPVTLCGTPHYMAPEVLLNKPYDTQCDMWSLGCILYECAMLEHAFRSHGAGGAAQINSLMQKVVKGQYKAVEGFSDDFVQLVGALLCVDPSERLSSQAVLLDPYVDSHFRTYVDTIALEQTKEFFTNVLQQLHQDGEE